MSQKWKTTNSDRKGVQAALEVALRHVPEAGPLLEQEPGQVWGRVLQAGPLLFSGSEVTALV